MRYDLIGTGAAPDHLLVRRGRARESANRLARKAALAELAGTARNGAPFGHGLSVTSPEANQALARDPTDCVSATRADLEAAGFEVRYTPTPNDSDHHTIILPKPVTDEVAHQLNTLFGRAP